MCRKIYLYFNDLNKAKRDVDPNEENKCVMVLLIWNKKNQEPIKFDGLLKESWNLYLNEIYFKYLPLYANFT